MTLELREIQDNGNNLKVEFEYSFEIDKKIYSSEVEISIKFGESEENAIVISLRLLKGDRLYFKKLAKKIKHLFVYCQTE